jgi:hypothetical protein
MGQHIVDHMRARGGLMSKKKDKKKKKGKK